MAILRHPVFLLCIVLALSNQLLELYGLYIWPLHTHLDDLLVLPITLSFALAAERLYFNDLCYVLPLRYTLVALLLFCVVFEALLPLLHSKYTADLWDVLAYTAGALLFQMSINKPPKRNNA